MKPTDLKCHPHVASVIGEAYADYELQRVIDCKDCQHSNSSNFRLTAAFSWVRSPQGWDFWNLVTGGKIPYEHGHEKPALSEITPANSDKTSDPMAMIEPSEELREAFEKAATINKYKVFCKGVEIDVYDVLMAYGVTNPADQHAIKKMLMPGKRGVKDANQDRREAIQSLERAIELAQSDR